jgi:Lar family restriction alleviation protein
MPDELKPCPFCGEPARILEDMYHRTAVWIGCQTLGCFGRDQWEESKPEAIAAWNRRPTGADR